MSPSHVRRYVNPTTQTNTSMSMSLPSSSSGKLRNPRLMTASRISPTQLLTIMFTIAMIIFVLSSKLHGRAQQLTMTRRTTTSDIDTDIQIHQSDLTPVLPRSVLVPYVGRRDKVATMLTRANSELLGAPRAKSPLLVYRMIGNDIPPFRSQGQSYSNARFVLEHEGDAAEKAGIDSRWHVNRVLNRTEEARIVALLLDHRATFTIDRFDPNVAVYADVTFDVPLPTNDEPRDILRASIFRAKPSAHYARTRAWTKIFSPRDRTIVHDTSARNLILDTAFRVGAKFVLPADCSTYIPPSAWEELARGIATYKNATGSRHAESGSRFKHMNQPVLAIPLSRMTTRATATHIASTDEATNSDNTNQSFAVIFAPGGRLNEEEPDGEKATALALRSASQTVRHIAFAVALPAVAPSLLTMTGIFRRATARATAVERISALGARMTAARLRSYSREALFLYDESALRTTLSRITKIGMMGLNGDDNDADNSLMWLGYGILRSGDEARQVQGQGGVIAQGGFGIAGSDEFDSSVAYAARNVSVLTFAWMLSGDAIRGDAAARAARELFINGASRIPHDAPLSGTTGAHVCAAIDATRLLRRTGALRGIDSSRIASWAASRLAWLTRGDQTVAEAHFDSGVRGTLSDVHTACIATAIDDFLQVYRYTALARGRLLSQYDPANPNASGWRDGLDGLAAWTLLSHVASRAGIDIWRFADLPSASPPKFSSPSSMSSSFSGPRSVLARAAEQIIPSALHCAASRDNSCQHTNEEDGSKCSGKDIVTVTAVAQWIVNMGTIALADDTPGTFLDNSWTKVIHAVGSAEKTVSGNFAAQSILPLACSVPAMWNLAVTTPTVYATRPRDSSTDGASTYSDSDSDADADDDTDEDANVDGDIGVDMVNGVNIDANTNANADDLLPKR